MTAHVDGVRLRRWVAALACGVTAMSAPAWAQAGAPAQSGAAVQALPAAAAKSVDAVVAPTTPVASAASAMESQTADGTASVMPAGAIEQLQQRIQNHQIAELRTTYNGTYGASLLFYPPDMTYYVALFHQKQFWRVVTTSMAKRAEAVYHDFTRQTALLAGDEIRRIQLQAQKDYMDKQVSQNEARLAAVQSDLAIQRQQEQKLAQDQQDTRKQTATLAAERSVAQARLDDVQSQIRALEKEQNSSSLTLIRQVKAQR